MTINYAHLFRLAHATAKAYRAEFCDYHDAFRWALTQAWIQVRANSKDLAGWTRGQAYAKLNELKAARQQARSDMTTRGRTAETLAAYEQAADAVTVFQKRIDNSRTPRGGFVQFRTSWAGNLYDADDVLIAAQ